jgi:RNA polymerase sigma factor (sigma-70 family)
MAEPMRLTAGPDRLAAKFESLRPHLTSVAYSMLGSVAEAQDAVQEAWLRLGRSDAGAIEDLRAWLTTVVSRICLDMLKARQARREDQAGMRFPEPVFAEIVTDGPEQRALMTEAVGLALLVVLENLTPLERLAFVLHDIFGTPFEDIGKIIGRTAQAARQLASRARRRVRTAPRPDADLPVQRQVVDAFLAAAREGDFDRLLQVLAPDVVLWFDAGPGPRALHEIVGAGAVAREILRTAPRFLPDAVSIMVNGVPGVLHGTISQPLCVLGCTVAGGRIAELHLVADRAKLDRGRPQPVRDDAGHRG